MTREAEALPRRHGHGNVGGARNFVVRIARAWRALEPEQRLAAMAGLSLWVTMLFPWYSKSVTVVVNGAAKVTDRSYSAYGAFSFVEAAVLLVSTGLLAMLFARGERRAFHLPGGDGFIVMLGGIWTAVLIFYRMLDTPSTTHAGSVLVTQVGLKWGIFFAMAAAVGLAVAGFRVRAAHRPEPPLPAGIAPDPGRVPARSREAGRRGERAGRGTDVTPPLPPSGPPTAVSTGPPTAVTTRLPRSPGRTPDEPGMSAEQLSFDVSPARADEEDDRERP
jgi:hypothetical protein